MNPKKSRTTTAKRSSTVKPDHVILAAYFAALSAFFFAGIVPTARVWGFNWWGYYPWWGTIGFFLLGLSLAVLIWRLSMAGFAKSNSDISLSMSRVAMGAIGLLLVASFVIFSESTHFTGDGYSLISLLVKGHPVEKSWDIGSRLLTKSLYLSLGALGEQGALRTFIMISIGSGALAVVGLTLAVGCMTKSRWAQLFLFVSMLTSGYMLIFFGHVENYAESVSIFV